MKVLEEGNYNDSFPLKVVCHRASDQYGFGYGDSKDFCGSVLEIEAEDIKKHKWFKYPDYNGTDYGVICPVCGKFIPVEKGYIPKDILKNAEEILLSSNNSI